MDVVNIEAEVDVIENKGENLFRYASGEQEVLFGRLLPFREMLYRKVSVIRDGAEIGDTMALSVGTHCYLEIFGVGGLKDVFREQAACNDDRESVRHLSAKDFQVGDKLEFSFAGAPGSSFAKILEDARWFAKIVSPPSESPAVGLHMSPDR